MANYFKPNTIKVCDIPVLETPIENEELLLSCQLTQFDREGYELLPIEQEFYKAAGVVLHTEKVLAHESGNEEGWRAFIQPWFEQVNNSVLFKLDHSFCVTRYELDGKAREQVAKFAKKRPELNKLLNSRAKWGADFCVDYITKSGCMELIHWEWDFLTSCSLQQHINTMQERVANTDWDSIIDAVSIFKNNNGNVEADVEGNFKAALFGLPKAFRLFKTLE